MDLAALPERLRNLPVDQLRELLCKANPAVWSEVKRGFTNAPVHYEWYSLMLKARRLCVVAPRDHAKTECFTINNSAWRSIYNPGFWTYVFAATADQAAAIKARIDAAVFEAEPDMMLNAYSVFKMGSTYANGSRVTAAGVGKAVRGAHPDMIVGDDVLEEETTLTEFQRKKMERWWHGSVGPMAHPGSERVVAGYGKMYYPATQIFLVGTPFHSQDLLMGMKANRLWAYRRYAAEFDPEQLVPGTLAVEVENG